MSPSEPSQPPVGLTRRHILATLTAAGVGTAAFQRAVADTVAATGQLTAEDIARAEWVADLTLTSEQRTTITRALQGLTDNLRKIRSVRVPFEQWPALRFDPEMVVRLQNRLSDQPRTWLDTRAEEHLPAGTDPHRSAGSSEIADTGRPVGSSPSQPRISERQIAVASVRQLGGWLRSGQLTSVELTQHCLNRLTQHDPILHCVVTRTDALALDQAARADQELSHGRDRGPLHGIPWGAKDLIAVPGYPTTWGAPQFLEQAFSQGATVYDRLCTAGAVLVAKLSLGALAMGDRWFGGQTRNPWNLQQGSSGSSAGSAAAVAAGLLPFALGSETLGSLISPTRRCGITTLRPTYGRVSRGGCMPLSWSMDKIGPMARTVDDCGLVLQVIHGADDRDPSAVQRWFDWPVRADLKSVRVGHVQNRESTAADDIALEHLRDAGAQVVPVELPDEIPEWALATMLDVEAATVFHELLISGDTNGLNAWPDIFRRSHFVSAVDFLHAARVRHQLMQRMVEVFDHCQLYVGGSDLGITNLTGHPTVAFPVSMTSGEFPQPLCASMTGGLYDEATLMALAALVEDRVALPSRVSPDFLP